MKSKLAVLSAMIMCLSAVPMPNVTVFASDNTSITEKEEIFEWLPATMEEYQKFTEIPVFDEEKFFVVVGIYNNQYTQLRYLSPKSDGGYSAGKVVLNNADENLSYGDVLIAEDDVELTKVYDFKDNPAYAMSYYYSLNEDVTFKNIGNCSELMEQKELSISDKNYDGSGHWSINLIDENGNEYYYGLNVLASTLGIDIVYGSEIGDVYLFAFNNGNIVVPLASLNEEILPGDVNGDSKFNVADVAIFQKWLLDTPDLTLSDWKSADLCEDGILNVFDLCAMKRKLIQ